MSGKSYPIKEQIESDRWDRFNPFKSLWTWDIIVETNDEDDNKLSITKDEEKQIVNGGFYGKPVDKYSIELLKKGKPWLPAGKYTVIQWCSDGGEQHPFETLDEAVKFINQWKGSFERKTDISFRADRCSFKLYGFTMKDVDRGALKEVMDSGELEVNDVDDEKTQQKEDDDKLEYDAIDMEESMADPDGSWKTIKESKYFGSVNQIVDKWQDHFLGEQFESEEKILDVLDGFIKNENRFGSKIESLWDTSDQFRREVNKNVLGLYQKASASGKEWLVMKQPQFASSTALGRTVDNMEKFGGPVVGEGKLKEQQAFKPKKRGYKGYYYVDNNFNSGKFEVRHTDRLPGHVFSSWDTQKEADADAKKRNEKIGIKENGDMIKEYSGMGKFNSALDELLYSAVLEGWASEETGDVSEQGAHYDFIKFWDTIDDWIPQLHTNFKEQFEQLTEEEVAELENSKAAIIEENDQGFIAVELFDSKEEAEEKWAEIELSLTGEDDDQLAGVEEDNEDDLMGEGAIGVGFGQASTCPCKKCDDEEDEEEDLKESKILVLKRDGKEIFRSKNESEIYDKLHDLHSGSWDHALKYEGYSIDEEEDEEFSDDGNFNRELTPEEIAGQRAYNTEQEGFKFTEFDRSPKIKESKKQIVKERFSDVSGIDDIRIEDELDPRSVDDYLPEDELDDEFLKGSDADPLDDDTFDDDGGEEDY